MSEGQPRRRTGAAEDDPSRSGDARPRDADEAMARIRQVLERAQVHQPPIPPDVVLAQIATVLAAAGPAARHGLSEEDLELYVRLWWDEQQSRSPP